jgi:hypothetical protein
MTLANTNPRRTVTPSDRRTPAEELAQPIAGGPRSVSEVSPPAELSRSLPITHHLTLAYICSLVVAVLMVAVSAAGFVLGSVRLYGVGPNVALGVIPSTAGILVPGFLAQDAFNLVFGMPLLLGALWLARRGALIGLLLWPGVLFYALYTYALRLVGAPFSQMFLPDVALVALSAYTTAGLVASVDGEQVRRRLTSVVPARIVGGILVVLAVLTLAQDAGGALTTSLSGAASIDPLAHHVWLVDLAVEVPAVLVGGILLWRHNTLGYVAGAGLLLQYGLTPLGLAVTLALQPILNAAPIDGTTIGGLLVFSLMSFVPLVFFARGRGRSRGYGVPDKEELTETDRGRSGGRDADDRSNPQR